MTWAILSTILNPMTAIMRNASEAWTLVTDAEKQVNRLQSKLKTTKRLVEDVEVEQFLNEHLEYWLQSFKELSYDMEDVLDDWETAVQKSQRPDHDTCFSKWKVCEPFVSCFSYGSQVVRRYNIASRIKDIDKELDLTVEGKVRSVLLGSESNKKPQQLKSTSFPNFRGLLGRDVVKEKIIGKLLCGTSKEGSDIVTIAIVGMGGIGKTALARSIYRDDRIPSHFDKQYWVCVSNPFDLSQIAQAILEYPDDVEDLGLKSFFRKEAEPETLSMKMKNKIRGKKIFLVLDDVRKDKSEAWEQLKDIFKSAMLGSRILVTAPNQSVVRRMGCSPVHPLDKLSADTCWDILSQEAFHRKNVRDRKNLMDIGRKIAAKCEGLPLVLKPLGKFLQNKSQEHWESILNRDNIWKLGRREGIYASFLLSYSDLPSEIKQCLLYCAIFPKDHKFIEDELVQHWKAQGYLKPDDEIGEDPFKYLSASYFFQDFDKDEAGNINFCKMHDSVRNFVRALTDGFVTEMIVKDSELKVSSKTRHLCLVIVKGSSSPMSVRGTKQLRSLVAVSHGFNQTTSEDLLNLFSGSKRLRLLEFHSFCLDAKAIACGIRNLIRLECFSLIGCFGIESLPEAVCELPNLQSLNLRSCHSLKKLPVGIGNLINLRYLCIEDCNSLTYYPKGISKLTSLVRLSYIRMRADRNDADAFSFGDLENLDLLGGNLRAELTGNALDWNEAKRAQLQRKKRLQRMEILHHSLFRYQKRVVHVLDPPPNLSVEIPRPKRGNPEVLEDVAGKIAEHLSLWKWENATD